MMSFSLPNLNLLYIISPGFSFSVRCAQEKFKFIDVLDRRHVSALDEGDSSGLL